MSDSLERASEMDAPLQQLKQKIDAEPVPRSGGSAMGGLSLLLVLVLRCIERMADHAVNVSQRVARVSA